MSNKKIIVHDVENHTVEVNVQLSVLCVKNVVNQIIGLVCVDPEVCQGPKTETEIDRSHSAGKVVKNNISKIKIQVKKKYTLSNMMKKS
jgi:hypothetical protein